MTHERLLRLAAPVLAILSFASLGGVCDGISTTFPRASIQLKSLTVENANEDDFFSDGDEPFFVVVTFESRFQTPNSTSVSPLDYQNTVWANGVETGGVRSIPQSMGRAVFLNLQPQYWDTDRLEAEGVDSTPKVVGVVALAVERDECPWDLIHDGLAGAISTFEPLLRELVENTEFNWVDPELSLEPILAAFSDIGLDGDFSFWDLLDCEFDPDDLIGTHIAVFVDLSDDIWQAYVETAGIQLPSYVTAGPFPPAGADLGFATDFQSGGTHYVVDWTVAYHP